MPRPAPPSQEDRTLEKAEKETSGRKTATGRDSSGPVRSFGTARTPPNPTEVAGPDSGSCGRFGPAAERRSPPRNERPPDFRRVRPRSGCFAGGPAKRTGRRNKPAPARPPAESADNPAAGRKSAARRQTPSPSGIEADDVPFRRSFRFRAVEVKDSRYHTPSRAEMQAENAFLSRPDAFFEKSAYAGLKNARFGLYC